MDERQRQTSSDDKRQRQLRINVGGTTKTDIK